MSQPDSVEQLTTEMREWGSLPAKWEWPVRIELLFAAERERYAKLEAAAEQIIKELRAQVRLGIDPAQVSSIADGLERALREPK